jgi:hypothetical protein
LSRLVRVLILDAPRSGRRRDLPHLRPTNAFRIERHFSDTQHAPFGLHNMRRGRARCPRERLLGFCACCWPPTTSVDLVPALPPVLPTRLLFPRSLFPSAAAKRSTRTLSNLACSSSPSSLLTALLLGASAPRATRTAIPSVVMPANRFSRSFSNLNLQADVACPPRPSTSLGYAESCLSATVVQIDTTTHAPRRRPRPPLLSLFRKPSFSSWGRPDPSAKSPADSTFSTSSFGSLGPRRRSSSEGGHLSVPSSNRRSSRMLWSPVLLPSLGVDEDPFAALPSPTGPAAQSIPSARTELDQPSDHGWLDDVSLERVGSFEGELACALRDVGSTPKRRAPAATEHACNFEPTSPGMGSPCMQRLTSTSH